MFSSTVKSVREGMYGVLGLSKVAPDQINFTNGTGFMVSSNYIVTAAHLAHVEGNPQKPVHKNFEVIRAPDVGQTPEKAAFVAEDQERDVALLRITSSPRSKATLILHSGKVSVGTNCGSLGFPLATVLATQDGKRMFNLIERFQGAYISAFSSQTAKSGCVLPFYETDSLMYKGSSGSPGFTTDGKVFGMHNRTMIDTKESGQGEEVSQASRLAISLWVPSTEIIQFCKDNKVSVAVR